MASISRLALAGAILPSAHAKQLALREPCPPNSWAFQTAMMRRFGQWALVLAGLLLVPAASADTLVTTIVTDPLTGVAMDGLDPVSYFLGADPQPGKPDYEYDWQGVPWYFATAANRDVFMRNPGVYAPQFGGHCVTSLSRGYLSDGKPRLYVIDGLKLYFFYSTANRDAFLMNTDATLKSAADNWPKLSANLVGPANVDAVGMAMSASAASGTSADAAAPASSSADASTVPTSSASSAAN